MTLIMLLEKLFHITFIFKNNKIGVVNLWMSYLKLRIGGTGFLYSSYLYDIYYKFKVSTVKTISFDIIMGLMINSSFLEARPWWHWCRWFCLFVVGNGFLSDMTYESYIWCPLWHGVFFRMMIWNIEVGR